MFILSLQRTRSDLDYRVWDINGTCASLLIKGKITGIGKDMGEHSYLYEFGSGNGKSRTGSYEEALQKVNNTINIASPGFKRLEETEIDIEAVGYIMGSRPFEISANTAVTREFIETLEELCDKEEHDWEIASDLELLNASMAHFSSARHVVVFEELMFKPFSPEVKLYPISPEISRQDTINRFSHGSLRLLSIMENARKFLQKLPRRIIICDIDEITQITAVKGDAIVASTHEYGGLSSIFSTGNCGAVNPEAIKALAEKNGMSYESLLDQLIHKSGVKNFEEGFQSMRQLVASIRLENISIPVQMLTSSIILSIAGLVALLGGIELLVISGDIGSDFPALRTLLVERLHILRLSVDETQNENEVKEAADITGKDCKVKIIVARPDKDRQAAAEIMKLLKP